MDVKIRGVIFVSVLLLLSVLVSATQIKEVCSLDSTLICNNGKQIQAGSAKNFVIGKENTALQLERRNVALINDHEGIKSVSFWFKVDPTNQQSFRTTLVQLQGEQIADRGNEYSAVILLDDGSITWYGRSFQQNEMIDWTSNKKYGIKPSEWNHLAYEFEKNEQKDKMKVFINGEEMISDFKLYRRVGSQRDYSITADSRYSVKLPRQIQQIRLMQATLPETKTYVDQVELSNTLQPQYCQVCDDIDQNIVAFESNLISKNGEYSFILPSTKPKPQESIHRIELAALEDEKISTSFSLFSKQNIDSLRLELATPDPDIDIKVVKVWNQPGYAIKSEAGFDYVSSKLRWSEFNVPSNEGIPIAELLVYNDQEPIIDRYDPKGKYIAPQLSSQLETSIPARTSKQFFVEIDRKQDGLYSNVINIFSDREKILEIPISIQVGKAQLIEPTVDRWIYYRGFLSENSLVNSHEAVSVKRLQAEFSQIRDAGFNGIISVNRMQGEDLEKFIRVAREVNFEQVVLVCPSQPILCGDVTQESAILRRYGFEPIFLNVDEFNDIESPDFNQILQRIHNLHSQNAKVFTTLIYSTARAYEDLESPIYQRREMNREILNVYPLSESGSDYMSIAIVDSNDAKRGAQYFNEVMKQQRAQDFRNQAFYYFQIGTQNPHQARFYSGVAAFLTKVDGISPYVYQHYGAPNKGRGSPYTSFDAQFHETRGYEFPQMATYPAMNGPIKTLEWKAIEEGIIDLKYLTTASQLIDNVQDHSKKQRLTQLLYSYLDPFKDVGAYKDLTQQDYDTLRIQLQEIIVSLSQTEENARTETKKRGSITLKTNIKIANLIGEIEEAINDKNQYARLNQLIREKNLLDENPENNQQIVEITNEKVAKIIGIINEDESKLIKMTKIANTLN